MSGLADELRRLAAVCADQASVANEVRTAMNARRPDDAVRWAGDAATAAAHAGLCALAMEQAADELERLAARAVLLERVAEAARGYAYPTLALDNYNYGAPNPLNDALRALARFDAAKSEEDGDAG